MHRHHHFLHWVLRAGFVLRSTAEAEPVYYFPVLAVGVGQVDYALVPGYHNPVADQVRGERSST